jgi:hypothetical protein
LKWNYPKFPLAEAVKTKDLEQAQELETIDLKLFKSWRQPVFDKIDIESDREKAVQKVTTLMNISEVVIYSDASAKKSNLGAAVVILDRQNNTQRSRQVSIGSTKHWSVHAAELIAIYYAIEMAESEPLENSHNTNFHDRAFTIVSDSKSELQAIANPSNKPGHHIVHGILNRAEQLKGPVKLRLL